jgi:hypothetical protein
MDKKRKINKKLVYLKVKMLSNNNNNNNNSLHAVIQVIIRKMKITLLKYLRKILIK